MAYNTIYTAGWSTDNRSGVITILKKDYIGTPTFTLKCKAESLDVSYNFKGWEDPIIGLNATFTFQNESATMSARLLMLMNAEEREYKVRITDETDSLAYTLFEGFLNCETIRQPYVGYGSLTLTASNYLSKSKYKYPDSVNTLQNISFIKLLDDILVQSGASYNIRVNCSIEETTYPLVAVTNTALDSYGVYTEMFWKNNIDRDNGLEILRTILTTFECFIYWYDGYWYIERYEDIWSTDKDFVEYETGASNINGSGVVVNETPASSDLQVLTWQELTQILSVVPGMNKIEINLKESRFYNLTINDFSNAEEIAVLYFASLFNDPPWRGWTYYKDSAGGLDFINFALSYKNISNGVRRTGAVTGSGWDGAAGGLFTRVKVTIGTTTSMTIKWKFATEPGTIPGSMVDPETTDVVFRYWLRIGDAAAAPTEFYFITQNVDSDDSWKMETHNSTSNWAEVRNEIEITADKFDQELCSYECQVTIPLYDVRDLPTGDTDIVLVIGTETFSNDGGSEMNSWNCIIGDVSIHISETPPDNVVEGEVTNDYLEELKLDMPLFDLDTHNYKNGVLCSTDFEELSTQWSDGSHTETLARMKLITKWRQYHKSMQRVSGDIHSYARFRPFQMFTDSEQSRVFVLGSFIDYADRDKKYIELIEYDNTEIIILT